MTEGMKRAASRVDWKDPLLWVSVALAITGGIQAGTGFLSSLAELYPIAFGVSMLVISIFTGVLTVIKSFISNGGNA